MILPTDMRQQNNTTTTFGLGRTVDPLTELNFVMRLL